MVGNQQFFECVDMRPRSCRTLRSRTQDVLQEEQYKCYYDFHWIHKFHPFFHYSNLSSQNHDQCID